MYSPGSDTPLYSVAAVARHTGVPAVTLRAWERRYGFPRPTRASGGRRLYTQRDIWTVRALRSQSDQGVPISRAIALLGDESSLPTPAEAPIGAESPLTMLGDQLLEALLDLAAGRADTVLSEALSLLSVEYGGWIFNARPELRARTPGVYLGRDALAAIATVEQLVGGGQCTIRARLRLGDVQK